MTFTSATAILALLIEFSLVAIVLRLVPGIEAAVLGGGDRRTHTLDGLRGIVAMCVVAHHLIIGWTFLTTGSAGAPPGNVANQLGSCSVAIFFMISAYLFCGKIVRRRGVLRLTPFVEGRMMRIVPLYTACVLAILVISLVDEGGLREPPAALMRHLLRWMAFDFVPRGLLNGDRSTFDMLGQIWTLRYEWMLYAMLPVLAWAVRRTGAIWPVFAGLTAAASIDPLFAFFVAGAACALLVGLDGVGLRRFWQVAGAVGAVLVVVTQHESSGWMQAALLLPFMVAVLQGRRAYALLGLRPFRFLGEISYSVYLTHGFVIRLVVGTYAWGQGGEPQRLLMFCVILAGVTILATITFLLIERPLMGRSAIAFIAGRTASGRPGPALAGALIPAAPATPPTT